MVRYFVAYGVGGITTIRAHHRSCDASDYWLSDMDLLYVLAWRDPGSRTVLIRCESAQQAMEQARLILRGERAISGDLYVFDGTKDCPLGLVMRGVEPLP